MNDIHGIDPIGAHKGGGEMEFTCIGFDVREWPWRESFGVDETNWPKNQEEYSTLLEKFRVEENEYQFLWFGSNEGLQRARQYILGAQCCNMIAIELPSAIVQLHDVRHGYAAARNSSLLDISAFVRRGLDICDFDGFFSVLNHPDFLSKRRGVHLIPPDCFSEALECVQYANILDASHSPFVVARVSSIK